MSAIAVVTLLDGRVNADSTVTVLVDGVQVARGPVPARTDRSGFAAPARIADGLAALSWRPVDHYRLQRPVPWGIELDVELAS